MNHPIVGVWSSEILYAPGSQEDSLLVFRSDGTGWSEWMNFAAHDIEFFEWTPTSPGWVAIAIQKHFERDLHNLKRYIEREPTFSVEHLSISIEEVETPLHGLIPRLEARLPGTLAEFYGLLERDADSWPRPQTPT